MMKKKTIAVALLLLAMPTAAFASTYYGNQQEVQALEARNTALTAYLQENVDAAAIYDENQRAALIDTFFASHPEYNNVTVKPWRHREPTAIEKAAIYRETLQTSANADQTLEMDVTYYDDGSYVLGIFTSSGTEQ